MYSDEWMSLRLGSSRSMVVYHGWGLLPYECASMWMRPFRKLASSCFFCCCARVSTLEGQSLGTLLRRGTCASCLVRGFQAPLVRCKKYRAQLSRHGFLPNGKGSHPSTWISLHNLITTPMITMTTILCIHIFGGITRKEYSATIC